MFFLKEEKKEEDEEGRGDERERVSQSATSKRLDLRRPELSQPQALAAAANALSHAAIAIISWIGIA